MKEGFVFQGVLGIHHGRSTPDSLFKTWDGRETVYLLDEETETMHRSTLPGKTARQQNRDRHLLKGDAGPQAPVLAAPKVGRNDRCPCGSGKKYKHCCGRTPRTTSGA